VTGFPRSAIQDLVVEGRTKRGSSTDAEVWSLNLDQIESDSGRILSRVMVTPKALGPSTYPFEAGTVLYSKLRPYLNKVVVADADGYATTELVPIKCDTDRVLPSYLAYFLRSPEFLNFANTVVAGAKMPRMVMSEFWQYKVPHPPLPEQRRIAAILDKADALRTKSREALAQLDRLAQSIFVEMFGDPATNPKGWETQRLDSICEVGSSKRVFVEELTEEGIPFFRGTEIGELGEGVKAKPTLFISKEHYSRLKAEAGVPRKGDLLLPSICPDGRIFVVDTEEPFYFKDARVLWIKVQQHQISSMYLRHYLKLVFAKNYSKIASGTTFAELKIFALKQLEIASPPIELQRRFESVVLSVDVQTEKSKQSYKELSNLFAAIQHRAFRGEL